MNENLPIDASDWTGDDGYGAVSARASSSSMSGSSLSDFARSRLIAMVEDARDSLVGQVRGLKSFADSLSNAMGDNAAPVSHLLGQVTGTIDAIADSLSEKSVEELIDDGRALVRSQPAAAVGLALATGFLAGRMLKAARN